MLGDMVIAYLTADRTEDENGRTVAPSRPPLRAPLRGQGGARPGETPSVSDLLTPGKRGRNIRSHPLLTIQRVN